MTSNHTQSVPVVLCFSGLDPTGGAGIQADIETITSMGGHPAPVITALTVQDTQQCHSFTTVDPLLIIQQARAVLEDMPVHAIKIGMLGSREVIESVHGILNDYPDLPVILDPIINAGSGGQLSDEDSLNAMRELLFPQTTILTPNSTEAKKLAPQADTIAACAEELQDLGCEYVLVTGTHDATKDVVNTLYGNHRELEQYTWTRLPYEYHGSGCTLASAIAGLLAQGLDPLTAIHEAQDFTWQSLEHAYRTGMGQLIPNRYFWARENNE
jgi:hydroxymethylpyrimidine/phosphomethylpyrimidine kinase